MKMRKWLTGLLSAVLCLTVVAGCSSTEKAAGEVTVNLGSEPPNMNPVLTTDATSGDVFRHVYEGLVTLDENDKAQAGVAEDWDVSKDGKTVTFKLRKDSKWNNGETVTAKDFKFAWDLLFTPATGSAYAGTWAPLIVGAEDVLYSKANVEEQAIKDGKATMEVVKDKKTKEEKEVFTPVSKEAAKEIEAATEKALEDALANVGYKAVDDYTFEVQLTGVYPFFVELMSFYSFLPINEALYNEMGGLDGYGTEATKIAYNGPFTITEWQHENKIVVEKNENYWNKDAIKLNKITFAMIVDSNTALNEYEGGNLDMVGLTGAQAAEYKKAKKEYSSYFDGANAYFQYNTQVKPFNNAKVRKALTMGIDVDQYVDKVLQNSSEAGQAFTTPSVAQGEFTKKVGKVLDRGNYEAAKKLLNEGLAEEGINPDEFTFTLLGDEGDSPQKTYAFFQEQWKTNLGVQCEIKQVTFKTRIANMQNGDFDVVFALWGPDYNDPMTYLDLFVTDSGNNHGKWSNAQYDALIDAARKEADANKRTDILVQAEKMIAEEMPVGIVYYRSRDYVCSERVKGVVRTAFSNIDLRTAETVEK